MSDAAFDARPSMADWGLGLIGSLLANGALIAVVLWSLHPQPVRDQDTAEAELQVTSQAIPHSQAQVADPSSEALEESDAKASALQDAPVPRSSAAPVAPPAQNVSAATPRSNRVAPQQPSSSVTEPQTGRAETLSAASAPLSRLATSQATPDPLDRAPLEDTPLAQANAPSTALPAAPLSPDDVILTQPAFNTVTSTAPETTALASQPADSTVAASRVPPPDDQLASTAPAADRIRADLVFPGGRSEDVDPQSLAAFEQFLDPGQNGQVLRDGLSGLLASIPCARVQLSFDPDSATLTLGGHLPENSLRSPILTALAQEMGQDIQLADNMQLLPRPQCGALSGIAEVGLPQSTDQITNPLLIGEDAQARVLSYSGGEQLFFDLTAPDYPAFVYVDYFDAGGMVLHLTPNELISLQESAPKSLLRVGAKDSAEPGLLITVGPPYGQEIAVAFAASHPLFDQAKPRPLQEPAAPYLAELKAAVTTARSENADFKGEWVYFLIKTQAP